MHDLSLTLFYKTAIDVEPTDVEDDILWSVVCDIRKWMTRKWDQCGVTIPKDNPTWTKLKKGCRLSDPSGIVQFVSAIYYAENGGYKWACSITENIAEEGCSKRVWVTEIGLSCETRVRGTVSLVLSYGDQPGFLGPCQEIPSPSVPGIVGNLLSDRYLRCSVSGVELQREARELKAGMFPYFWCLISDPKRETPVIFISPKQDGDNPSLLIDPQTLADALGPSALVYYSLDKGFADEMLDTLPNYAYRCSNGTVRAYAPRPCVDDPSDQYRHRYFSPAAIEAMGPDTLVSIFRRAYAQDVHFYETMVRIDVVRDLINHSSLAKRAERKVEEVEEAAIGLANDIEDKLLRKTTEADALKDENDQLKSENHALQQKVATYEFAFRYGAPDGEKSKEAWPWPRSPRDAFDAFRKACDDRIVFTQRAIASLDDCCSSAETLWNALYDLRTIAYELYMSDAQLDIEREFNARSKFKFSRNAGSMTRKSNALTQQYFDEYDGRQINVETHIKSGSKESDPKFIRVYFAFDAPTQRIVVSSMGVHFDVFSTQFMH